MIDDRYLGYVDRYVTIGGKGIEQHTLDMGLDAVRTLYKLAEEDKIPNAESIKIDYPFNCDVAFKGSELLKFLGEYYPEYLEKFSPDIDDNEIYNVLAVDYS